jgi:hypothetical protein
MGVEPVCRESRPTMRETRTANTVLVPPGSTLIRSPPDIWPSTAMRRAPAASYRCWSTGMRGAAPASM